MAEILADPSRRTGRIYELTGPRSEDISTMARLHAENRYDRKADGVEQVTGRPPTGVAEYVRENPSLLSP
ncbi:hypothetical protein ABZX95_45955 [Streptomyces sp. NPDC004232]|uniref:hypothetical protein n=1 Tax=unclassified Streptomyces TaxID=2593676 RepID=UPI001D21A3CC|nr:hypothetical protein [Streptomyces sp. tea 10]